MPWFFAIPEFLKKRACRYLLQHYLGQFLEEKISLEDLTVDLSSGIGTITNVPLNVEAINETLEGTSAPVKVSSGYIGRVRVTVPWTSLLKDSCKVEISGLALAVIPNIAQTNEEPVSMTDSLFFSMTSSLQLAEEVIKCGPSPGEDSGEHSPGFEGMEALARAIELVLARVQITLSDATVQVNYRTLDNSQEYFLKLRVKRVEFYDEMSRQESSVDTEGEDPPEQAAVAVKVLQLSGLTVELGSTDVTSERTEMEDSHDTLLTMSPPAFSTETYPTLTAKQPSTDSQDSTEDSQGVPVAMASGELSVRVKIKQSETLPGPKLEVEGVLGSLHFLLSPQQLQMLIEMASGIASIGNVPQGFTRSPQPGQSRPIPKKDMTTIESQLRHHVKEERLKKQQREDLRHADPWENSLRSTAMAESTYSSSDEFYTLDLNSSYTGSRIGAGGGGLEKSTDLDDSFVSTRPGTSDVIHGRIPDSGLESIPFHEGSGLQQLSQSPPSGKIPTPQSRSLSIQRVRSSSTSSTGIRSKYNHTDSHHDTCKYTLTFSGVTIALLEADPAYTYTTPGLPRQSSGPLSSSGSEGSCYGRYSSVDEGGLDPMRYFEGVVEILKSGVNKKVFQSTKEKLEQVLPNDHLLLWLSTVRMSLSTEGPAVDLTLSVASAELWEYLYRNEVKLAHITKPISVSPIVQLVEESAKPCLKMKLSTFTEHIRKRSYGSSGEPQTSIELAMTTAHVNADVTLLDRVQPIMNAPLRSRQCSLRSGSLEQTKQSLYMTTSNVYFVNQQRQAMFNQTVATDSCGKRGQRASLRVNCATMNVSLRFPAPDLRDVVHPPWHRPSLQPEVLYVTLSDVGLSTAFHPGSLHPPTTFEAQVATIEGYLSCDGTHESRTLFLTVGSNDDQYPLTGDSNFNAASISVTVQPVSDSVLNELGRTGGSQPSTLEEMDIPANKEPSPFSGKRAMFSTRKAPAAEEEELHSEELVMPGSPKEMAEFEQCVASQARYSVRCFLPTLNIHLPSRSFMETLFNRIGTDLVLWKPASPQSVEKANTAKSMFFSTMDIIQPAVTKEERYQLCKSVLKEEDSDEESYDKTAQSFLRTSPDNNGGFLKSSGFTQLAFSLSVERCRVSMLTVVKESSNSYHSGSEDSVYESVMSERLLDLSPRRTTSREEGVTREAHGLVVTDLRDIWMFAASGYLGDSTHDYFCAQVKDLSLSHLGNLEAADYSCVDRAADVSVLSKLQTVVFRSGGGVRLKPNSEQQLPMVAVAMELKLDKGRNTKTNKCAVALHNTTVQHYVSSTEHNCFKQLGDFFDLSEEKVPGLDPPSFITELHIHTEECAIEYRPLHLPLHMMLVVDSVSLSTNVVAGSPVLRVRIMLDGTRLFLSHKQEKDVNLRQDFVCVMELDWFELIIRFCNNSQSDDKTPVLSRLPEITMECSSNVVHLRTCVDSCIALRDLLVYMATDGDLRSPNKDSERMRHYSSLVSESSPLSTLNLYSSSPPVTTSSMNDREIDIGDMINEAMEDISNPVTASTKDSRKKRSSSDRHRGKEKKSGDLISKLGVHQSSEKSILMCFDSSDSDDDGGVMSAKVRRGGRMVVSSGQQSIFSESDDDDGFCIVETPTSTCVPPGAKPVVKSLLEEGEELEMVEYHFSVPDHRTDQLQRPKDFPEPVIQYTLKEITVIWHLYGGSDFGPPPLQQKTTPSPSPGSSPMNARRDSSAAIRTQSSSMSPGFGRKHPAILIPKASVGGSGSKLTPMKSKKSSAATDWKTAGGQGRDHSVLMEIELDKLRIQQETYPSDSEQASRLVLLIRDMEIRDRLAQSQINKFLYQYTTDAMPRQSHANMVSLKVLTTRPELEADPIREDVSVRLSILPIRLNIDQDAVFFIYEFFKQITDTASISLPAAIDSKVPSDIQEAEGAAVEAGGSPTHSHREVFIRSFVFHPDLPIRIDYVRKGFNIVAVGTMAGILLGLSHLDSSEVRLKSLTYKKGLLGWDEAVKYASSEWLQDIKTTQLPYILKGVGPMHHVTQLLHGVVDLVKLPYDQYMEDGRIVWGIQRGASSFTTSSGIAFVELTSRALETVQWVAQMAYDLVTPAERHASTSQAVVYQHKAPHQPLDLREGVANAYDVVTAGIGGTARDLMNVATQEHEERGMAGAVGGVLRQLPGTILAKPVVLFSEATRHVLGGVKNQFVPDARREASEKWRTTETTD